MPPVVDSSGFLHPADALGGTGPAAGGRRGGPRRSLLALDSEAKKSTLEERAGRLQTFAIEVLQSYLGSNVNTEDWTREGKAFAPEVRAFEGIRDGYFSNLFLTRQHLEAYIPRTTAAAFSSTHSIPVALVWSNRATFLQRIFAAHPPASQPNDADSQTSQNEEQWSEQSRSERLDYFVEALDGFGRVVPWKEWRDGDDRVLSILGSMKAQYYILSLQSGTNQPLEAVFESKLADNFQPPDESDRKRYKRNPTKERKTEAKYNQICKEWMQKLEQARGNADQLMHLFPYHEMAQEVLFYMNDLCHTDLDLLLDNAPTVPSAALAEAEADGGDLDIAAVLPALDAAASQDFLRDLNVSLQGMQRSEVENSAQRFRDGETPASSQFEYSREPVGSGDVLHRDGNFYGSPNVGTQMTPVNSQLLNLLQIQLLCLTPLTRFDSTRKED
ncbi:hypothetical protein BT69DRAFT_337940 [Atractiella rhizophila]|nr:hypothetical protein BT69DRAFT_337940 [Atractiella rhizophila]